MPIELPTQVLQGLGLAPPPVVQPPPAIPPFDSALEGAPGAADIAPPPLPPEPALAPAPEPPTPILPSLAPPLNTPPPSPEPSRDFPVPVSAFGAGPQPAAPQQPQRPAAPMTPEAQLQRAQQKQSQADVDQVDAIAAQRDVNVGKAREDLAAHDAYAEREKEIEKQRKAFAEESEKTRAQKQAYVASTMADVDNYKVDQNKFVNQMGLGGMAGWGIAMIMSGIGDSLQRKQGPNPVVQMLQQRMHDSVVAQIDERDQLKAKNARAQHELDKYDSWSKDRMAQISLLDAQNEKRLANMLRTAAAKAAEPMAQAAALDAAAKLEQSSADKAQKSAEFASTNDIAKRQLQVSQGNLGVSQFNARENQRHNLATEENAAQGRELEAAKLVKQGKDDQARLLRERGFGGEAKLVEIDPKDVKPGDKTIKKDGKTFLATTGHITMRDGSPFIPQGEISVIAEAQKKYLAQERLRGIVNRMIELGPEYLSSTVNSDQYQQMKQEFDNARLEVLQFKGMGAPQSKDMEYAAGFIGTPDPTRWKDSVAGLKEGLKAMERDQAATFRGLGLDKEYKHPANADQSGAAPSAVQQLQTSLKREPDANPQRAWQTTYAQTLKASGGDIDAAKRAANEALGSAGAITPVQRADLDKLKTQAIGGDVEALAAIEDVAKTGGSATIKRMATEALSEIRTASAPQPTTSSAGVRNEGYNPIDLINRFHRTPEPTLSPRTRSASLP